MEKYKILKEEREIIHPNQALIKKIKTVWRLLKNQTTSFVVKSIDDSNKKFEFIIRYKLPDEPVMKVKCWKLEYENNREVCEKDYIIYLLDNHGGVNYDWGKKLEKDKKIPIKYEILNQSDIPEDFYYVNFVLQQKLLDDIKRNFETYLRHEVKLSKLVDYYNFIDITKYN